MLLKTFFSWSIEKITNQRYNSSYPATDNNYQHRQGDEHYGP